MEGLRGAVGGNVGEGYQASYPLLKTVQTTTAYGFVFNNNFFNWPELQWKSFDNYKDD
jgi:hypothetical protein